MEENGKIALVAIVCAAGFFFGGIFAGWGIFSQVGAAPTTSGNTITLKLSGSTTVYPIATDAAAVFMSVYPNYNVIVSAGGSGVGIANVGNGTSDIGMSSRTLTTADYTSYPKLNATTICRDGIAIIISTANGWNNVTQLTISQVQKIYNGTFNNWKQVGGPDHNITRYSRESGSGTRASFEDQVMKLGGQSVHYGSASWNAPVIASGSPQMNQSVVTDQYGIGYIGIGFTGPGTHGTTALNIGKTGAPYIACNSTNVKSMIYPLSRLLFMITNGPATTAELTFINFMCGPAGQQAVVRQGFVTLL